MVPVAAHSQNWEWGGYNYRRDGADVHYFGGSYTQDLEGDVYLNDSRYRIGSPNLYRPMELWHWGSSDAPTYDDGFVRIENERHVDESYLRFTIYPDHVHYRAAVEGRTFHAGHLWFRITVEGRRAVGPDLGGVSYQAHIQNIGWQSAKVDGQVAGSVGSSLRLEALKVTLNDDHDIVYQGFVAGQGWQTGVSNGAVCGTTGQSRALEAIRIRVGRGHVYYTVHIGDVGWAGPYADGDIAGVYGHRLEAIQIYISDVPRLTLSGHRSATFNGLFYPTNATVLASNAGYFTLTASSNGVVSGRFLLAGASQPFSGMFTKNSDTAQIAIKRTRPTHDALELTLRLNPTPPVLSGTLRAPGAWEAVVVGHRVSDGRSFAGYNTVTFPGANASLASVMPSGDGIGTAKVSIKGGLSFLGSLGDGTVVSQGTGLGQDGEWPVYASLAHGRGLLLGWGGFATNGAWTLRGSNLIWSLPAGSNQLYRAGFTNLLALWGARYQPPVRGASPFGWTNGYALLDGGGLRATLSNSVVAVGGNLVVSNGTSGLKLTVVPAAGLIRGGFTNPTTHKATQLKGVIVQGDPASGHGWFTNVNQSGFLDLRPRR